MKKYLMMGAAAIALASCSHDVDLYNPDLADQMVLEKYNQAFINNFGVPAASQDWGFGGATRGVTRADDDKWTDTHNCTWESEFTFSRPANAVDLTKGNFTDAEKKATAFYFPAKPDGTSYEVNFNYAFNIPAGAKIYIEGKVTGFTNVNYDGKVTFYNTGEYTHVHATAGRHKFVNTGMLTIVEYGQVGDVYNSGVLVLAGKYGKPVVANETAIYSMGESALVTMPDGISYFNGTIEAHNKVFVEGDWNLQNDDQYRYICALEVTGKLYLNKGALYTSYIEAGSIEMNAFPLYLNKDAHVVTGNFDIKPSGSFVYGHTNSKALIEVESFTFENKNDLTHTFSDNIYFQVSDYIDINGCFINSHSDGSGKEHHYTDMADYLANTEDEYHLVAGRLNAGDAEGSPACGGAWKIGTTPEYTFLARVFCEDLSATDGSDFDFNDVVFDVYTNGTDAEIEVLAAGGTLPLTVAGEEVHALFGVSTSVMVNTKAADYTTVGGEDNKTASKRIPVEGVSSMADLDKIEIWVEKNNGVEPVWYPLEAPQGQPAAKFAVAEQIGWVRERRDINLVYTEFKNWVQKNDNARWYDTKAADKAGDLLNNK